MNRIVLQTIAVSFLLSGLAHATDLASLPPNTWVHADHPKVIGPPGGGAPTPQGWNCLVYDSVGKRIILLDRWGDKAHGSSIYANSVMAYDVGTNTLTCLKESNWKVEETSTGGYRTVAMPENSSDPTPLDRHPYECVAFVPQQNAIYLGSGANQTGPGGHPDDTWKFDIASAKWSEIKTSPPGKEDLEDAMIYDPAAKAIVRPFKGRSTWCLDIKPDSVWRDTKAKNNSGCGAGGSLAYDSKRSRILLYGGPGQSGKSWESPGCELWSYTSQENTWKRLSDGLIPVRFAGFAYDSHHDAALVHARTPDPGKDWPTKPGCTAVYLCATDQWVKLPDPAPKDPMAYVQTVAYDEAHDVFVCLDVEPNNRTLEWWWFRLAPEKLIPAVAAKK